MGDILVIRWCQHSGEVAKRISLVIRKASNCPTLHTLLEGTLGAILIRLGCSEVAVFKLQTITNWDLEIYLKFRCGN